MLTVIACMHDSLSAGPAQVFLEILRVLLFVLSNIIVHRFASAYDNPPESRPIAGQARPAAFSKLLEVRLPSFLHTRAQHLSQLLASLAAKLKRLKILQVRTKL